MNYSLYDGMNNYVFSGSYLLFALCPKPASSGILKMTVIVAVV